MQVLKTFLQKLTFQKHFIIKASFSKESGGEASVRAVQSHETALPSTSSMLPSSSAKVHLSEEPEMMLKGFLHMWGGRLLNASGLLATEY